MLQFTFAPANTLPQNPSQHSPASSPSPLIGVGRPDDTHYPPLTTCDTVLELTCFHICSRTRLQSPNSSLQEDSHLAFSTSHFNFEVWCPDTAMLAGNVTLVMHGQELFLLGRNYAKGPVSYIRCTGNTQASAALHATDRNATHSLSPFRRPTRCLCPTTGLETCEEAENHPAIPAGVSVGRGRTPCYLQNWQSVSPLVREHLQGANEAPLLSFPVSLGTVLSSSSLLPL